MSIINFIGNTPLVRLSEGIFAKVEAYNPSGSVKDRAAKYILTSENLATGSRVVEATSGNFGISLAMLSAVMGYKFTAVMPRSASPGRERIIRSYGGEVVYSENMASSVVLASTLPGFHPCQFENPLNIHAHYETTGPEIWRDSMGEVDILVAGIGSGGTLMGTGKYLRQKNPNLKLIGVLPRSTEDEIEGIGAGFSPPLCDFSLVHEMVFVEEKDARRQMNNLEVGHGLFVGMSSGAAFHTAQIVRERKENVGKNIVVILPDSADRYF